MNFSDFQPHRILVPVDFSESPLDLLQHAAALAEKFDAGVTVLRVVQLNIAGEERGIPRTRLLNELHQTSGYVAPMSGIAIGVVAGVGCFFAVTKVKALFGYDDSLDAFGVHGVGGTIGAILTGVFAQGWINAPFGKDAKGNPNPVGWIDGNPHQVINQIIAVAISWVLAAVGTLIILKIVDAIIGVRVDEDEERQGLDITQHDEVGYNF